MRQSNTWIIISLGILGLSSCAATPTKAQPDAARRSAVNITELGAVGDGETNNTAIIQKAIDGAAEVGGGIVVVPAGQFVTGALFLKSNVTLHIVAGGALLGSQDFDDYPVIDGRWEGIERKHYASLINGDGLENIAVTGRGLIDGRAQRWWAERKKLPYARGRLIGFYRCKNILISGLTLTNSPAWTVNPIYCENITMHDLTVLNPDNSPNTDGLNPDSCRNVRISNCHIDVGDDCITLKSGKNEDGRRVGMPCENITVTNCTMIHGHGGVVIGSEMSGGVKNVTISNCVFDGTKNGIRMKTQRGRGGSVEDICVTNIVMRNVRTALRMNMFYHNIPPEPVSERTPAFRHITISNIRVNGAREAGLLIGLPEMPISDVTITDARFRTERGIAVSDARNLVLRNVQVDTEKGPAFTGKDVALLDLDGFTTEAPHADAPVVKLENTQGAFIRHCWARPETSVFVELIGSATRDILLTDNRFGAASRGVAVDESVDPISLTIK